MSNSTPNPAPHNPKAYVYLMRQPSTNSTSRLIKIGKSHNPIRRVSQLQTGNPSQIVIEMVLECCNAEAASAIEQALHTRYADRRIGDSEWFEFGPAQRFVGVPPRLYEDDSVWEELEWLFMVAAVANPPSISISDEREQSVDSTTDQMRAYWLHHYGEPGYPASV